MDEDQSWFFPSGDFFGQPWENGQAMPFERWGVQEAH